jgi:hypothetical protein
MSRYFATTTMTRTQVSQPGCESETTASGLITQSTMVVGTWPFSAHPNFLLRLASRLCSAPGFNVYIATAECRGCGTSPHTACHCQHTAYRDLLAANIRYRTISWAMQIATAQKQQSPNNDIPSSCAGCAANYPSKPLFACFAVGWILLRLRL